MMGIPRELAIMLGAITLAITMALGQMWFLFVAIPVFVALRIITSSDSHFYSIYMQAVKIPEVLD